VDAHPPHDRAIEIFERLIELDEAEWPAQLARLCAGDEELRARVERMLAADARSHSLLDAEPDIDWSDASEQETPATIGPYRLIRELGRGGMATVYLAERVVGEATQRVALKRVRRGIDTEEVLKRFAQETRVLASLEHPAIARFYDARSSLEGQPYLAMECVDGLPLTEACDAERLNVRQRTRKMVTVCEAVQYAHQRLVVHRDLKPSNVLVTKSGEVKLLDFGIAKLLTNEESDGRPLTRTGVLILTPEYAAPEQLRGDAVTTATDVYALGRVLHELLTGHRSGRGGRERPRSGETEPGSELSDRPSSVVRSMTRTGTATDVAEARATTPERLRRTLQGDLDTIVMKALDPEPARRYASPGDLADDLRRYLAGRPIEARPATLAYRARMFARRNRSAVAAATVAAVLLAGMSVVYTAGIARGRDVAEAEAAKAKRVTDFLQSLLGEAYPSVSLGDQFSMSELLARATERVSEFDAQPDVQAELLRTLGDVYREQARFPEALALLQRAVSLHREAGTLVSPEGGQALSALGHVQYERRDYESALATHRESLDVFEAMYVADDSMVLYALNNMATAAAGLGDLDEAIRLHEVVLDRHQRVFADTSQLVHTTYNNLGQTLHTMEEYDRAEREFAVAIELRRLALPVDHPSLALTLMNLGSTYRRQNRLSEAEAVIREAMEVFERVYGPEHPRVALAAYNLGQTLGDAGDPAGAAELFRRVASIDRGAYGDDHIEVGLDLRALGRALADAGDCDDAVEALREADRVFEVNNTPLTHSRRLTVRARLGECLTAMGRHSVAVAILTESLDAISASPDEADPGGSEQVLDQLVRTYRSWGRPATADSVRTLGIRPTP
jgi:serine/threonine-protein kinase